MNSWEAARAKFVKVPKQSQPREVCVCGHSRYHHTFVSHVPYTELVIWGKCSQHCLCGSYEANKEVVSNG